MNCFKRVSVAIALIATASCANAQVYGEAAYSWISYENSGYKADLGAIGATIGYEINKNLAIEGMLSEGISDDSVQVLGLNIKVKGKDTYGVFLKPKAVLGDVELYAKLGWAKSNVEYSIPGASVSDSGSDFAYGVGMQYSLSPKTYITGGYMKLYDKDSVTIDGWSFGFGYKF